MPIPYSGKLSTSPTIIALQPIPAIVDRPLKINGEIEGTYNSLSFLKRETRYKSAISTKSLSTLLTPSITFVQIIGNIVRNPIKRGTPSGENQINASKVIAMIGMDRTTTRIGLRSALNDGEIPAQIPKAIPKNAAETNPIRDLHIVEPTTRRKPVLLKRSNRESIVFSGGGRI